MQKLIVMLSMLAGIQVVIAQQKEFRGGVLTNLQEVSLNTYLL